MGKSFLIYGSNGYTGDLIARLAVKQGLHPILAGRSREKIVTQAAQLGLEYRVFAVADACLRTKTHYLDITGEIAVFESLAVYSTGILNIEVFSVYSPSLVRMLVMSRYLGWLLGSRVVQSLLKRSIKAQPAGPNDKERTRGLSLLWGEAADDLGNRVVSRMRTPESYALTAMTAVAIVQKVLAGDAPIGFQTPSLAYGADFILQFEGVAREDVGG